MFYILQAFNLPLIGNHAVLCFSLVTIVKNYKTNRSILQLNISKYPHILSVLLAYSKSECQDERPKCTRI